MPAKRRSGKRAGSKTGKSKRNARKPRAPSPNGIAAGALPADMPLGAALARALLAWVRTVGHSMRGLAVAATIAAVIAAIGFGVWSLRPVPVYSSEEVRQGSAFDVAFRIDNTHTWLTLPHIKIECVLEHVRASGLPPTLLAATNLRLPAGAVDAGLAPGQSATFNCPFRSLIGHPENDDPGIVQRSEIYFRATYNLPWFDALRWTENSEHYVLNSRILPPRWMPKPGEH